MNTFATNIAAGLSDLSGDMTEVLSKAQSDNSAYMRGTVQLLEGFGSRQAKFRPFKQDAAVKSFGGWVYAMAMLNAHAFARVPLRLYVRRKAGYQKFEANNQQQSRWKSFNTRKPSRKNWQYLSGYGNDRPSESVLRKIADFGDDFEEVTEPHPALRLLNTVNPWMDGFQLSVLRLLYLQITGNSYLTYTVDPQGVPNELLLMPSQWTSIIPDRAKFIAGYEYGRRPDITKFAPEEVIHWKLPNLDDVYYGKARTEAAWNAMQITNARAEMDLSVLKNMGRPDWMVIIKNGGPDNIDRVEAQVDAKLKGKGKAGNMLVVTGDIDAKSLNFPPAEIGTSDRVLEEMANCFGVPISKVLSNDPNKAGAETGDAAWMRDTILPYCRMDEETLNARYLPLFDVGDDAVLAYDNPVPTDKAYDLDRKTRLVGGNIMLPNEARQEEGLPPEDWGNQPIAMLTKPAPAFAMFGMPGAQPQPGAAPQPGQPGQPAAPAPELLNGAQMTAAVSIVAQVVAGALPRDSGIQMLITLVGLDPAEAEKLMGTAGTPKPTTPNPNPANEPKPGDKPAADDDDDDDESKSVKAEVAITGLPQGEPIARILQTEFAKQRSEVVAKITEMKSFGTKDDEPIKLPNLVDDWNTRLAELLKAPIQQVMSDRGKQLLGQLGVAADVFSVFDRNIPAAAAKLSLQFAESTNATTSKELDAALKQLRQEISDGLVEGDTRVELRKRVEDVFDRASKSRAETIARTEASRASHAAELMSAKDSGVVEKKMWLLSADACPICEEIAAANPGGVDLDKSFAELGGEYGSIDGPPAHPNCQCSLSYKIDEQALSPGERLDQ